MIKHIPFSSLGLANYSWLQSRHHFSFAHYYDAQRMGFGALRVVKDDTVAAGHGFSPHGHRDMEIISFVRSGALTHQDSEGNQGVTHAGQVQVMSAGTGIVHSEYNLSNEPLTFYQIWIEPNKHGVTPRWQSREYQSVATDERLPLLVSGFASDSDDALFIHQEARIYGGRLRAGTKIKMSIENSGYLLVSDGQLSVFGEPNDIHANKGDAVSISNVAEFTMFAHVDTEVILIDVPEKVN